MAGAPILARAGDRESEKYETGVSWFGENASAARQRFSEASFHDSARDLSETLNDKNLGGWLDSHKKLLSIAGPAAIGGAAAATVLGVSAPVLVLGAAIGASLGVWNLQR